VLGFLFDKEAGGDIRRTGGIKAGIAAVMTLLGSWCAVTAPLTPAKAAAAPPSSVHSSAAPHPGYRLLGGDGGVFAFTAPFEGSAATDPSLCPPNTTDRSMPNGTCWSLSSTPDGGGYWILNSSTGVITTYGDAISYGSPAAQFANVGREFIPNFIDIVSTPDGKGYWVLALGLSALGSIEQFGNAGFFGDELTPAPSSGHVGTPVAMAATPSGNGYWITDSDGGVFAFGDARFYNSMGGVHLNAPIVGMAATPDGHGYWLAASDGGVFAFGDASFGGSVAGVHLNGAIVDLAANPIGDGYWLAGADGGVFALGGAPFEGSMAGMTLTRPIFTISA
jgi:hypothetical protein